MRFWSATEKPTGWGEAAEKKQESWNLGRVPSETESSGGVRDKITGHRAASSHFPSGDRKVNRIREFSSTLLRVTPVDGMAA